MKSNLNKIIVLACIICFMCVNVVANSALGANTLILQIGNPIMTVDGENAEIDPGRDTVPVVENGRTLVPIRAIIEALGGIVGWDGEKQEVTLTYKDDVIKLVINSNEAYLNGEKTILDVSPKTINERTMLPIRYIAESFKFDVEWDGETSTVTVKSNTSKEDAPATPDTEAGFDVFADPSDMTEIEEEFEDVVEINPEDEETNIIEE